MGVTIPPAGQEGRVQEPPEPRKAPRGGFVDLRGINTAPRISVHGEKFVLSKPYEPALSEEKIEHMVEEALTSNLNHTLATDLASEIPPIDREELAKLLIACINGG